MEVYQKYKLRYMMLSMYEKHPDWINDLIEDNQDIIIFIHVIPFNQNPQQPAVIIYEFKGYGFE